ncbi:MAG TPA: NAD(P)-dependent oxidoreductase, partial [Pseudomonadales bacterium]|nr:NAD(P)-dependent oxidoreductase [Pseudomonadales bacterium]
MAIKIGFLGIGLMGLPMCKRLLAAGYSLSVWNRTRAKADALATLGAHVCETPAELAAQADLLMLCLADARAIVEVVLGTDGIATIQKPGLKLIDFSSTDPDTTRTTAHTLAERSGIRWIDCPVSGGVVGAESGQLVMMAGGDPADVDLIRPFVSALGSRLTYMGPLGSGQITKICNQLIVASNALLIAEAIALAKASGVD